MRISKVGVYALWSIITSGHLTHSLVQPFSSISKQAVLDREFKTSMANDTYDEDEFFKKFWHEMNGGLCDFGQVPQRNKTVCCYVTSCSPGFEIKECNKNGTEDECSPCERGFIQLKNISSFNMSESKCFEYDKAHHENCPIETMRPYRKEFDPYIFPYHCECLIEKCYVKNDVGDCDLKEVCDSNFQMNRISGICEPCPWYAYKFERGCQPCTMNETLVRQGRSEGRYMPPNLRTTTEQVETIFNADVNENQLSEAPVKPENGVNGDNGSMALSLTVTVLISVIALIALMLFVLAFIYFVCKKRRSQGQSVPPSTPTDIAPLLPGQVTPGTLPVQNVNGVGNRLYQHYPQTPSPIDGEGPRILPAVNGYGGNNQMNGVIDRLENGFQDVIAPVDGHRTSDDSRNNILVNVRPQRTGNQDIEQAIESTKDRRTIKNNFTEGVEVKQEDESAKRQDVLLETEIPHGAVGGTNDCIEKDKKFIDQKNCSEDKKEINVRGNLYLHDNNIGKLVINMSDGDKLKRKPGSRSNEGVGGQEENVSSVLDSSISTGLSTSPTLPLRNIDQHSNDEFTDSNERGVTGDDVAMEAAKSNEPPCRPELSFVPTEGNGCDVMVADVNKQAEKKIEKASDERAPNIVRPLQQSANNGERQVARVAPRCQNSLEVRHMSGYPSDGMNNDDRNINISMSYAILHANSDLDTGIMGQRYDVGNISDIDYYESSYVSRMNSDQVSVRNSIQPMDEIGVGVTRSVQPMGQREAPEGRSISYASENDNFVSGIDMQQTGRKVVANELDPDITHQKQMMCSDTQTKLIDTDDDLTEYKRKIKQSQKDENYPDVGEKESEEEKGKTSEYEDSINSEKEVDSKAEYNVEDILYEEDTSNLTGEDKSVSEKTDEINEKSFELKSFDVRNMQTGKESCSEVTEFDSIEDDKASESFEINSKDIKMLDYPKAENEGESVKQFYDNGDKENSSSQVHENGEGSCSFGQTEESFELDSCDIQQIAEEEISRSVKDGVSNDDDRTCSRESSFEIDSADLVDINASDNTDNAETCDRKEGGEES